MSLLNPGGKRAAPFFRLFGFENIKRALQRAKPDHARNAGTSIALGNRNLVRVPRFYADVGAPVPHEHKREIARRLRQQARKTK
jgi:hypothetical protein